jgi:hypothetical protein
MIVTRLAANESPSIFEMQLQPSDDWKFVIVSFERQ